MNLASRGVKKVSRSRLISALGVSLGLVLGASWVAAASERDQIPVVDLHVDLPYRSNYKGSPFNVGSGQYRADKLVEAGVSGVVLPLFVPKDAKPSGRDAAQFEGSYASLFQNLLKTPPYSLPGCSVSWVRGELRGVQTWLSFEDSGPVEPTSTAILSWILRGVRVFGIVHTEANVLATSSGEPSRGKGLSERGAKFVELVWKHGGVVDVSHASDEATNDMLHLARQFHGSIIATHSNARAIADHPRNLTDAQIRGIAELGGVVGVNFHGRFLEPKTGTGSLVQVVEQFRYIRKVGGIRAVAIGSDFEGGIRPPEELRHELGFVGLSRALRKVGFSESEVKLAFAENALRVLCAPKN